MLIVAENQGDFNTPSESASHIVAGLLAQKRGFNQLSGYHPQLVKETMRNSAFFRAWMDALPADLTGLDLSPLYDLAQTGEETSELKTRERDWQPDALNLSSTYNGPIGEEGEPLRCNVRKWREAVEKARKQHASRFTHDLNLMHEGDVPVRLREATMALVELALCEAPEDGISEWEECSSALDVAATSAALRLCLAALCEIETRAAQVARETDARLRRDLARVQEVRS